ncbi:MAG: hypothetical protein F9K13_12100 [Candidatus Methylomirabilis oxygeniifera]|uniref:DUF1996 domain-containing protein n=1 Tax=Methylomirabilis oxygeniifera TaxID=671143 RepID=D5MGY3_METO1|nr:MAG: hypothetical protein F9K13_12100 [Candidatus Methylomirabilis oxyfera]CBE69014.1 conserved exported protein of unknown function [Candidatus Methylomirabilis oxyfera]
MRRVRTIAFAALLAGAFISADAWAFPHANIRSKDTLDAYTGRNYQEGTSAVLSINIGHGCTHSGESYTTRLVTALFPNSSNPNLSGIAYTTDGTTNYEGNALYGIKPVVDQNWKQIQPITGTVPTYYNHGAKSTDVRAVHWEWGYIPDNFAGYANVSVSFPKFQPNTCYNKIQVDIPVIQYCQADSKHAEDHMWKRDRMKAKGDFHRVYAWMKEATSVFPTETIVAPGYVASLTIVRNLTTNPLPASCGGTGQTIELYPTAAEIDMYLPPLDGDISAGSGSGGGDHMH